MNARVTRPADRRRRKPTKQGVVLSRELIVETALRLIEHHGAEALSVRRLGHAVGCDPSSIYRYFHHTDDLMLAVTDALIGRTVAQWVPTGDWRSDLRDIGLRVHATALASPHASALTSHRVTAGPHEVTAVEAILGVLRRAGFPDGDAVRIYHAFIDQALAFGALDSASATLSAASRDAEAQASRTTYARLPAATHPNIAAAARHLIESMPQSSYPAALDMLLDATEAQLHALGPRPNVR